VIVSQQRVTLLPAFAQVLGHVDVKQTQVLQRPQLMVVTLP